VRNTLAIAGILALVGSLISCGRRADAPGAASDVAPVPGARTFYVKGVIKEIKPDGTTAIVNHETIPGYMMAMTMPIEVKDPAELSSVQPGDEILFRLIVTEDDAWMDQVTRVGQAATAPTTRQPLRQVPWVEPVNVGDALPNYSLTNQLGNAFHLDDFRGRALAFTFIFTRCPLPTFCPRMSNHFAAAARLLMEQPDAPRNWHLLTISFDPEFDTPAVLARYAGQYGYSPEYWTFATGAMVDIDALTEQFGMNYGRVGDNFDHNLRTVVVDARGTVRKIFVGNEWQPDELAAELLAAARIE
jgi:protein SCO1